MSGLVELAGARLRNLALCWLLPGWLIGLAAALWVIQANYLLPPLNGNVLRILVASSGAVTLVGAGMGLGALLLQMVIERVRPGLLEPGAFHRALATGLWAAWLLRGLGHMARFGLLLQPFADAAPWLQGAALASALLLPLIVYPRLRGRPGPATGRGGAILAIGVTTGTGLTAVALIALALSNRSPAAGAETGASASGAAPVAHTAATLSPPLFEPLPGGLHPEPAPGRLIVVAVDGLEPSLLEAEIAAGRAPNLARLRAKGAWGELQTLRPTGSPRIWNTVATGRLPRDHGILGFASEVYPRLRISGLYRPSPLQLARPVLVRLDSPSWVPFSSRSRKVKALWNLCTEAGIPVGVSGWMASWPAEPVEGFVVSDHAFFQQDQLGTFRHLRESESERSYTFPPEAIEELRPLQSRLDQATPAVLEPYVDLLPEDRAHFRERVRPPEQGGNKPLHWLTFSILKDEFYARSALRLQQRYAPRVLLVYLQAFDQFGHLTWRFGVPEAREQGYDPRDLARFGHSMPRVLHFIDDWVGRITAGADAHTTVIVLSDHGWGRGPDIEGRPAYGHGHAPPGVLIASGYRIARVGHIEGARILDVAPTLLYLLGLPISDELPGHILDAIIDPTHRSAHPVRTIARFEVGAPRVEEVRASNEDDAIMENLRALGYVE